MLRGTYYSNGTDNYRHNEFSHREWSAPTMVAPYEMKRRIDSFNLVGRKVSDIRAFGHCFNFTRDWIEERAYNHYGELSEEERQLKSDYDAIDGELLYDRWMEIDNPLLIRFEDGDTLEVDVPQVPELRISMNCIPFWINDDGANADAREIFAPNIGGTIVDVQLNTYMSNKDPMLNEPFDDKNTERELFKDLIIVFDNGSRLVICGWIDYLHVYCCSEDNKAMTISFKELKEVLYNWEDVHEDEKNGFCANSMCIYLGEKGFKLVDNPNFTIGVNDEEVMLAISSDDMVEIMLAYETVKFEYLDEYEDTELSYEEWIKVLKRAKELMEMETFDEMFSYVLECIGKNKIKESALYLINNCCEEIWDHKNKYLYLAEDLERWTTKFVKQTDKVMLYGY